MMPAWHGSHRRFASTPGLCLDHFTIGRQPLLQQRTCNCIVAALVTLAFPSLDTALRLTLPRSPLLHSNTVVCIALLLIIHAAV